MARPKSQVVGDTTVEFVDAPPPRAQGRKGIWEDILGVLIANPGHWARIRVCESSERADSTVQNLNQRKVIIPKANDNWEFVARGAEVFGIYHGKRKGNNNARVRRA
jgi:hypothetical protein